MRSTQDPAFTTRFEFGGFFFPGLLHTPGVGPSLKPKSEHHSTGAASEGDAAVYWTAFL